MLEAQLLADAGRKAESSPTWPYLYPARDREAEERWLVFTSLKTMRHMLGDEWKYESLHSVETEAESRRDSLVYINPGTPTGVTLTVGEYRMIRNGEIRYAVGGASL